MQTRRLFLLLFLPLYCLSQQDSDTTECMLDPVAVSDTLPKLKALVLPVIFYTPETRLGFGLATSLSFRMGNTRANRLSQINVGGAYTLERQILSFIGYDIWLKNNKIVLNGEFGYYRYYYYFWGIGEEIRKKEQFGMTLPKIRFEGYYRLLEGLYAGLKFTFEDVTITQTEETGRLGSANYYSGTDGGRVLGGGLCFKYDTRNHNFYPTTGYNIYAQVEGFSEKIGSSFNYSTIWINIKRYFDLKKDRVIGINAFNRMSFGDVPFFQLSQVGGENRMRGYYEGFHRDKQLLGWQAEYRFPIPLPRVYLAVFYGNAVVAENWSGYKWRNILTTVGGGIRIDLDKQRKIHGRYDFGLSREGNGSYLTLGEAF